MVRPSLVAKKHLTKSEFGICTQGNRAVNMFERYMMESQEMFGPLLFALTEKH